MVETDERISSTVFASLCDGSQVWFPHCIAPTDSAIEPGSKDTAPLALCITACGVEAKLAPVEPFIVVSQRLGVCSSDHGVVLESRIVITIVVVVLEAHVCSVYIVIWWEANRVQTEATIIIGH